MTKPAQEPLNLDCKSVQKRLATQWGYVEQPSKLRSSWEYGETMLVGMNGKGQPTTEQSSLVQEPAPSREWVGLSDDEIEEVYGHANLVDWRVVRAIEAKLRENNNG